MSNTKDSLKQQEQNIPVYENMRKRLEAEHFGKFVVISDGEFLRNKPGKDIRFFLDGSEALKSGLRLFGEGTFSLIEIGEKDKTLGFHSENAYPLKHE